jgi:broad specificity phosphatase PhoE
MKKTIIFILLIVLSATALVFAQESENESSGDSTTFILVRHAEKTSYSDDPGLTEDGVKRALKLQEMLEMANVSAIYSTNYKRTKATVQAVSEMMDVPVTIYEPVPDIDVTEQWIRNHRGETVLISGHSNTIPGIANQLLGRTHFDDDFDESDYGNFLIITAAGNERSLLHLRF